jgi:hypothetical protein
MKGIAIIDIMRLVHWILSIHINQLWELATKTAEQSIHQLYQHVNPKISRKQRSLSVLYVKRLCH